MSPIADNEGSSPQLLLNPAAGGAEAIRDGLGRVARKHGIRVRVVERGQNARQAAHAAAEDGARTLAVAGGDGSVAAVAGVAMEHDLPLVVVPVGTLNHFARDLGLDLARPLDALDAIASTHERLIARTLLGSIEVRPTLRRWISERLEMGRPGETIRAGIDGEPANLEAPLRFTIDPGALRVLVPEGLPANRQAPPVEVGLHAARTLLRWLSPTLAARDSRGDPF